MKTKEDTLVSLTNDLETLRFKFNSPRDKKLSKEFNIKINIIKEKIKILLTQDQNDRQ